MMHFIFDFCFSSDVISPQRLGLRALLNATLFCAYPDRVEASPIQAPPIIGVINK